MTHGMLRRMLDCMRKFVLYICYYHYGRIMSFIYVYSFEDIIRVANVMR